MKTIKQLLSFVLIALFGIASVISPVSAAKGNSTSTTGTIKINNAVKGEDYSIYQILKIASFDVDDNRQGKVSYIVDESWYNFFNNGTYANNFEVSDETLTDGSHYVTLIEAPNNMEQFASDALNYAKTNNISATSTKTAADNTVEWTGLELGYYLVESTVGVILSLDSTVPNAEINEKNGTPTIDKTMTGDLIINNGSIGDIVDYTITLNNIAGLKNVKVVDTISSGLTYYDMDNSFVVKNGNNILNRGVDYELVINDNTFTLTLLKTTTLEKNSVITITYKAQINENSLTNIANTNKADLQYGKNTTVEGTPTETYTYGFKINKTDSENIALTGAKFRLYDAATAGNEIKVVLVKSEDGINYYRVATAEEIEAGLTTEIEAGNAVVDGLKIGKYYLEETSAPDGYNKLASRVEIEIALQDGEFTYKNQQIINTTSPVLPSTGAMGTVLFTIIGSIITIGAGIILITKYRMSKYNA